ncbi:MAG TPA: efflux transporter outer membrane subunit [Methylophilus sp.]
MKAPFPFRLLCLLLASLSLAGCVDLAPLYQRPTPPVPATVGSPETSAVRLETLAWQEVISEPRLRDTLRLALENNRDLRVASLNIEKARALYQVQRADLFPTVTGTLSETASKGMANTGTTSNGTSTSGSNSGVVSSGGSSGTISHVYRATVGFSAYELDLFSRIRNLNAVALQTYLSNEETRKSTQISLVGEVATAWLTLAADQAALAVATQTLQSQQQTYTINQKMFDLGVTNALSLQQLRTSVEAANVAVATYRLQIKQDAQALNLLAGISLPATLLPGDRLPDTIINTALPTGIRSEQLLQRPDVRAAEHLLQGADANIGALRAAFFPTISLTTTVGTASTQLNGLFDQGSGIWTFVPQVSLPIFNGGRNRANLEAGKLNRDILLAQYEKTVQTAFSEVANALAQREGVQQQLVAQRALVTAAGEAFRLAEARYQKGVDSYLVVLDAQRTLYTARQTLLSLQLAEATSQLTLYKVLGGGWH